MIIFLLYTLTSGLIIHISNIQKHSAAHVLVVIMMILIIMTMVMVMVVLVMMVVIMMILVVVMISLKLCDPHPPCLEMLSMDNL